MWGVKGGISSSRSRWFRLLGEYTLQWLVRHEVVGANGVDRQSPSSSTMFVFTHQCNVVRWSLVVMGCLWHLWLVLLDRCPHLIAHFYIQPVSVHCAKWWCSSISLSVDVNAYICVLKLNFCEVAPGKFFQHPPQWVKKCGHGTHQSR